MMSQRPPLVVVPIQRTPEHQPWCSNHIPGADASDFGTCMTGDIDAGNAWVGLSATADGVRIDYGFVGDGDSVDGAERFALAILCQVARARGVTPPASATSVLAGAVTS